jgi:hypothetical protein
MKGLFFFILEDFFLFLKNPRPLPFTLYLPPSTIYLYLPPSAFHPLPSTLHLLPSTFHPPPSTLYLPPSTIYPLPSTLYLPPSTFFLLILHPHPDLSIIYTWFYVSNICSAMHQHSGPQPADKSRQFFSEQTSIVNREISLLVLKRE